MIKNRAYLKKFNLNKQNKEFKMRTDIESKNYFNENN